MSAPDFSVIIPTCHRNALLAESLERLAPGRQTMAEARYEVVVTDDGAETTAEALVRARFPWARWTAGPRRGPAANRNHGVRLALGKWLVFTDDDCLPDAGWLAAFAAAQRTHPGGPVFEGRTYPNRARRSFAEAAPLNETGGPLWSCNFMIRRAAFEAVGGFDERFPYPAFEDVDLNQRLRQRYDVIFVPQASVCHPWRPRGGWRRLKRTQHSLFIYLSLHPDGHATFTPLHFLRVSAGRLARVTLPGLFRYRGRGVGMEILQHLSNLQTAVLLLARRPR